MFKKIKQNFEQYYSIYFDYFLINTFLSLIIFKINRIFFKIPIIYIFGCILVIIIIFKDFFLLLGNKIKNTYIFNFILYYNLLIKDYIYNCIFDFIDTINFDKNKKIFIFLFFFIISYFFLTILFYISFKYNIILFFFFLLISIFNLLEKQFIFNIPNINIENLDFKNVQKILKIQNKNFNKNKNLYNIQKRYTHFNELRKFLKDNAITIITSTAAGTLFTGYLQHNSIQVQKEGIIIQREQLKMQQQQIDMQQEKDKILFLIEKQKIIDNFNFKKQRSIDDIDLKINNLKINMDTNNFWNKVDYSQQIELLEKQKKNILKRKSSFEELKSEEELNILHKKIKTFDIDNIVLNNKSLSDEISFFI